MDPELRRLQKLAKPRAKLGPASTRKLGAQTFGFDTQHDKKEDAQYRANKLKRRGHSARVIKSRGWWCVYWKASWE